MEREDLSRLALLTSVISIAPDAIIAVDHEYRIILFNEGAEDTFGYRRDEVWGNPLTFYCPSGFGLPTPITFANSARRLIPLGTWVNDREFLPCIRMATNFRRKVRSAS